MNPPSGCGTDPTTCGDNYTFSVLKIGPNTEIVGKAVSEGYYYYYSFGVVDSSLIKIEPNLLCPGIETLSKSLSIFSKIPGSCQNDFGICAVNNKGIAPKKGICNIMMSAGGGYPLPTPGLINPTPPNFGAVKAYDANGNFFSYGPNIPMRTLREVMYLPFLTDKLFSTPLKWIWTNYDTDNPNDRYFIDNYKTLHKVTSKFLPSGYTLRSFSYQFGNPKFNPLKSLPLPTGQTMTDSNANFIINTSGFYKDMYLDSTGQTWQFSGEDKQIDGFLRQAITSVVSKSAGYNLPSFPSPIYYTYQPSETNTVGKRTKIIPNATSPKPLNTTTLRNLPFLNNYSGPKITGNYMVLDGYILPYNPSAVFYICQNPPKSPSTAEDKYLTLRGKTYRLPSGTPPNLLVFLLPKNMVKSEICPSSIYDRSYSQQNTISTVDELIKIMLPEHLSTTVYHYIPSKNDAPIEYLGANGFLYPISTPKGTITQGVRDYLLGNFNVIRKPYNQLPSDPVTLPITTKDELVFNLSGELPDSTSRETTVPLGLLRGKTTGWVYYTKLSTSTSFKSGITYTKVFFLGVDSWLAVNVLAERTGLPIYTPTTIPTVPDDQITKSIFLSSKQRVDLAWIGKNFPSQMSSKTYATDCPSLTSTFQLGTENGMVKYTFYLSFKNTSINDGKLIINNKPYGNFVAGGEVVCNVPIVVERKGYSERFNFSVPIYFQGRTGQPVTKIFDFSWDWLINQNWDETKTILVSPSPLSIFVPPSKKPSSSTDNDGKDKKKLWIYIGIGVGVVLLILLIFGLMIYFSKPAPVVKIEPRTPYSGY